MVRFVARGTAALPVLTPHHLKSTYMAPGEVLHLETRATKLFYFPGPVAALLIFLFLDYAWASALGAVPGIPLLTNALQHLPNAPTPYRYYAFLLFLFITLLIALWILVRWLRWIRTVYAVTDHRVIRQKGIVSRDVDEIPLAQVRGVDVHQTGWERVLHYGTIRVSAEGGAAIGNEEWQGIPNPFQLQRTIETAMQNASAPPYGYPPAGAAPGYPPPQPPRL